MPFTTKKIDSAGIGETLRKARAKRALSLEGISKLSGVQIKYLERIENGEYEKLPADVYTKCFLKRYAEVLGISPKKILNQYKEELGLRESFDPKEDKSQKRQYLEIFVITPKIIRNFFLLVLGIVILGYLSYQLNFTLRAPQVTLESPSQDFLSVNEASIEVKGRVNHASSLTINTKDIYINADGYFKDRIDLKEGLNTIYVEARNNFGKTSGTMLEVFKESP